MRKKQTVTCLSRALMYAGGNPQRSACIPHKVGLQFQHIRRRLQSLQWLDAVVFRRNKRDALGRQIALLLGHLQQRIHRLLSLESSVVLQPLLPRHQTLLLSIQPNAQETCAIGLLCEICEMQLPLSAMLFSITLSCSSSAILGFAFQHVACSAYSRVVMSELYCGMSEESGE